MPVAGPEGPKWAAEWTVITGRAVGAASEPRLSVARVSVASEPRPSWQSADGVGVGVGATDAALADDVALVGNVTYPREGAAVWRWTASECHRSAPCSCRRRNTGTPRCSAASCRTLCSGDASSAPRSTPTLPSPFG